MSVTIEGVNDVVQSYLLTIDPSQSDVSVNGILGFDLQGASFGDVFAASGFLFLTEVSAGGQERWDVSSSAQTVALQEDFAAPVLFDPFSDAGVASGINYTFDATVTAENISLDFDYSIAASAAELGVPGSSFTLIIDELSAQIDGNILSEITAEFVPGIGVTYSEELSYSATLEVQDPILLNLSPAYLAEFNDEGDVESLIVPILQSLPDLSDPFLLPEDSLDLTVSYHDGQFVPDAPSVDSDIKIAIEPLFVDTFVDILDTVDLNGQIATESTSQVELQPGVDDGGLLLI